MFWPNRHRLSFQMLRIAESNHDALSEATHQNAFQATTSVYKDCSESEHDIIGYCLQWAFMTEIRPFKSRLFVAFD